MIASGSGLQPQQRAPLCRPTPSTSLHAALRAPRCSGIAKPDRRAALMPSASLTAADSMPSTAEKAPAPTAGADAAALARIDGLMEGLAAKKAEWAALPLREKVGLLQEVRRRLLDRPLEWTKASAQLVKRDTTEETWAGELVATITTMTTLIDGYIASLSAFEKTGVFPAPPARTTAGGQTVVQAFPWGWKQAKLDPLGLSGVSAELYLRPGSVVGEQGHAYTTAKHDGRVCVALGAGNQQFLALSDALHQLFVERNCVIVKYHPIQAPVAPFIDYVLEPLAARGYFASVLCDLPATQHLLYHPLADCVCMTGGTATHDAIVWGPPSEQAERKARDDPLLKVPITSELGCVTPWLVVPGPWSEAEVTHHARQLANAVINNCSCNCLAPKVVLLAEGWEQGDALIAMLKQELAGVALPAPYYPGIRNRYAAFQRQYPGAEAVPAPPADPALPCGEPLPVLVNVLPQYPADPKAEAAFQVEPFAPVVTFVKVPCTAGPGKTLEEAFLEAGVRAANNDLWGTLSCTVLVHPETEARHGAAVAQALDVLQYGSVVVNAWSVMGYVAMAGHWGGFQNGQTLKDVGSGIGGVHNYYLFDKPQKTVVRTPFVSALHPMPPSVSPVGLGTAKVIAGLAHSGLLGVLRMLLWAK